MIILSIISGISDFSERKESGSTSSDENKIDNLDKTLIGKLHRVGDINNDGKIDKEDIELLEDYINGEGELTEEQKANADLNGDGKIDKKDLQILRIFMQRRETEERVRDLEGLYSALSGEQTSAHIVLGVDNGNIESVKSELDSAKALLAILNNVI